MTEHLGWRILYVIVLMAVTAVEHVVFARRLEREPVARFAMGVATVMGLAFPLALIGAIDIWTWFMVMAGFAFAGAVTWGMYLYDAARIQRETIKHVQEQIGRF